MTVNGPLQSLTTMSWVKSGTGAWQLASASAVLAGEHLTITDPVASLTVASYNSEHARGPLMPLPPAISTCPLLSKIPVAPVRAVTIEPPVEDQVPVCGS